MKFGTLYAYWTHEWQGDYIALANKIKSAGFDVMEVSAGNLLDMSDAELYALRDHCRSLSLEISSNIGPPQDKNVASSDDAVRRAGVKYLIDIMKQMDKLNSRVFIGAMYNAWPCKFEDNDIDALWSRSVGSMKEVGDCADSLGIDICLEVLNRFETNLMTCAEDGVRFCRDVDKKSVKLLLDTFHMNIEEDDLPGAILTAGSLLGHMHVGEGNRKLPGMGHLPWAEMGKALHQVGFDGMVVMEPFMKMGGAVGSDIKVWRDLSGNADEAAMDKMIADSLVFLRTAFA